MGNIGPIISKWVNIGQNWGKNGGKMVKMVQNMSERVKIG